MRASLPSRPPKRPAGARPAAAASAAASASSLQLALARVPSRWRASCCGAGRPADGAPDGDASCTTSRGSVKSGQRSFRCLLLYTRTSL